MIEDREENEESYTSKEDYDNKLKSKRELAQMWDSRIEAAERTFKSWANRFSVDKLYQYYEGYQWFFETDENNKPYVINMIYSTIETKLPNLLFDNPQFSVRARPVGLTFNEEEANKNSQIREDALNYVCSRAEFGLGDSHELAILDSFFGFGVMEVNHSKEEYMNPNIPTQDTANVLDEVYAKQIPFDTFRVSANANWNLTTGRWYGYYEYIEKKRLTKFKHKLKLDIDKIYSEVEEMGVADMATGKISISTDITTVIGPSNTIKVWKLWDLDTGKFCLFAPNNVTEKGDSILIYEDYDFAPHSFMRFGKRRKGWYPYPMVWNWLSPQDELNDSRQAQRLHRKRFSRKYLALVGGFENEEELDKFIFGPDGTICKVLRQDAIKAVEDAPLDPVSIQSLSLSYDDFNRISGTPDEYRSVSGNRTTATQSTIMNQRAQIRDSKDSLRVGDFMTSIGKHILKALRKVNKQFWIKAKLPAEGLVGEVKPQIGQWKTIPPQILQDQDHDIDLTVTSISPISAQQDKTAFMEFLAIITQYELLAFSPALLREAAYRCGYKNEATLNQFQQMAQLASIGRLNQLKGQVASAGPQPTQPGMLPQQQMAASTPPDMEQLNNLIFNKTGVQQ